jgi:hypothetical protein
MRLGLTDSDVMGTEMLFLRYADVHDFGATVTATAVGELQVTGGRAEVEIDFLPRDTAVEDEDLIRTNVRVSSLGVSRSRPTHSP